MKHHVGFTGTQHGMTGDQLDLVEDVLHQLKHERGFNTFHHGDCIGADAEAHRIARRLDYYIVLHPPVDNSKRAFCDFDESLVPLPYLERNRAIVRAVIRLIVTPKETDEQLRSGTWSTVRYAKKNFVRVELIEP